MVSKRVQRQLMSLVVACLVLVGLAQSAAAAQYKVLVVMSYEEDYLWCQEIKQGVDSVLGQIAEIRYFYMNTKKDLAGGPKKAEEAYALYQSFQPDGVITADDNAQAMFVVPFLKDKVKTPIMFNAVNADPSKYGFPATNVSGILESEPMRESFSLAKQLVPAMQTFGAVLRDDATGRAVLAQIEREQSTFPIKFVGVKWPKTLDELMAMTEEFKSSVDALYYSTFQGLLDAQGQAMTDKMIIPLVAQKFGKPILTQGVLWGGLCAVIKTGYEQGEVSAKMLLEAMQGKPIKDIPITRNQFGRRVINVDVLQALGITPKPEVVRGAELLKTEK